MFGAIAGGIASALAGGAMSKLFGGGQKAASGGMQGDVLATENHPVGTGDVRLHSAVHGPVVPSPDSPAPPAAPGPLATAGQGLLDGPCQAGTPPVLAESL